MDYCTTLDCWAKNIYGTDNSSSCSLLWTTIPVCGQVSVLIGMEFSHTHMYTYEITRYVLDQIVP